MGGCSGCSLGYWSCLEGITGECQAVADSTRLSKVDNQVPNEEQVKLLMQLCDSVSDPKLKVKCIGTLESLAQYPESIEANRVSEIDICISLEV